MAIVVKHGEPSTLLTAAQMKGQERAAQQQLEITERLQAQQREFEYRTAIRQQDMSIDLQMQERAKMWEIEKMELRSRLDFQREEQQRQRKLDSADNALQQIDKEVLAGRMTEQEARPLKLKYEMNKIGVDVPTSLLPTGDDEDRYGVQPYWMKGKDAPEGSPERQLYEAKMEQQISGVRTGTVPYYLDPEWVGTYPEAARQAQEARGIFLSDEEFDDLMSGGTGEDTKQLDVGVRTGLGTELGAEGGGEERVRVISPEGQTGTILRNELQEYTDRGFKVVGDTSELETPEEETPEDIIGRLKAGKAKFYKPSLRTFATMSPLKLLMERRKAKKIVR